MSKRAYLRIPAIILLAASLLLLSITLFSTSVGAASSSEQAYVAAIGETKYTSLQDAVADATDGQTISMIANHTIDVSESSAVIQISNKTISIDLNGFTVIGNVTCTITAFIETKSTAHLTLLDGSESKTGAINLLVSDTAGAKASNLMRNNNDCSITIESGNYYQNKSEDGCGMIDSRCDTLTTAKVGVYINGGNFKLENIGTKSNGSPWLINTSGQNERNVIVTGGTFNTDIAHQYYPFEADLSNACALRNNGDGTYTVVPALCYVNEAHKSGYWYINEIGYTNFADAFNRVDAEKHKQTNGYATDVTVLNDCYSTRDGLVIPADKAVVLNFNEDFVVDGDLSVPGSATLNITGDLRVIGNLDIAEGAAVNVSGNIFIEKGATVTNAPTATVTILAPAADEDQTPPGVIDIYGTLLNDGAVNLNEEGARVNIFGTVTNNGIIGTTEELADTVSINIVTKIGLDANRPSIEIGTYSAFETAATPNIGAFNHIYTQDCIDFYPLPENPAIMLCTDNNKLEIYETIHEAYDNANTDDIIFLLDDILDEGLIIDKSITIDFNQQKYVITSCVASTGSEALGLQVLPENNVTLKNGSLSANAASIKILLENYSDLTIENMHLDGTGAESMACILSNNSGTVSIIGNTSITAPDGAIAFNVSDCSSAGYDVPTMRILTTGMISGGIAVSEAAKDLLTIENGSFSTDVGVYCEIGYHAIRREEVYIISRHSLKKTEATSASCTEDGNEQYWACLDCNKFFSDENCANEIAQDTWIIPSPGHAYSNGCATTCLSCNATRAPGEHFSEDGDGKCDECQEKFKLSNLEILLIAAAGFMIVLTFAVLLTKKLRKKSSRDRSLTVTPAAEQEDAQSIPAEAPPTEESDADIAKAAPAAASTESKGSTAPSGQFVVGRYAKSFTAKLIEASPKTKQYYSTLKNAILSFKRVTSRVSWSFDSINLGRKKLAKFVIKGKTLVIYLALDPSDYANTKYALEQAEGNKYKDLGSKYKITGDRRLKYALDLIGHLREKFELSPIVIEPQNYVLPYEPIEALIERGLVKELVSQEKYDALVAMRTSLEGGEDARRSFVSAKEADNILSDSIAESILKGLRCSNVYSGKKAIINTDTLSQHFNAGDVVTLQALKAKGLVQKSVGYVKVLARGTLNKPLTVSLQGYSISAVKMIVLTGGKITKA